MFRVLILGVVSNERMKNKKEEEKKCSLDGRKGLLSLFLGAKGGVSFCALRVLVSTQSLSSERDFVSSYF